MSKPQPLHAANTVRLLEQYSKFFSDLKEESKHKVRVPELDKQQPSRDIKEYDIASLYMVSSYCFVTKASARRPGAAASVERRRASRSDTVTLAASQAFERMHNTLSHRVKT